MVVHYSDSDTARERFLRESTCEHPSQGCAVAGGPERLPRVALSLLYLTYVTVYLKGGFIHRTRHH